MRYNVLPVALAFLAVAERTLAQCSDPCMVASSVDAATAFEEDSDINAIDSSAAIEAIDNGAILGDDDSDPPERRRALRRRQSPTSVCCNDDEECLSSDATTELRFGDGSYAFVANNSYYAPNGSPIDPATGATLSAGGSSPTSVPSSAAISVVSGPGFSSLGATKASAITSTAISMVSSPGSSSVGATTSTARSGSTEGQSTLSAATPTRSEPSLSTGSEPTKTSVANAQAPGQASSSRAKIGNTVAAAGIVIIWMVGTFYSI
ncbi:MAG: hypothetical protein Q9195_009237 [Heterodermia aff. obscurata]